MLKDANILAKLAVTPRDAAAGTAVLHQYDLPKRTVAIRKEGVLKALLH